MFTYIYTYPKGTTRGLDELPKSVGFFLRLHTSSSATIRTTLWRLYFTEITHIQAGTIGEMSGLCGTRFAASQSHSKVDVFNARPRRYLRYPLAPSYHCLVLCQYKQPRNTITTATSSITG